jgi:hypothetical protein
VTEQRTEWSIPIRRVPRTVGVPRPEVEIGLRVSVVAGRGPDVHPTARRRGIEAHVEVFGPELNAGRIRQRRQKPVERELPEPKPAEQVGDGGWIDADGPRRVADARRRRAGIEGRSQIHPDEGSQFREGAPRDRRHPRPSNSVALAFVREHPVVDANDIGVGTERRGPDAVTGDSEPKSPSRLESSSAQDVSGHPLELESPQDVVG